MLPQNIPLLIRKLKARLASPPLAQEQALQIIFPNASATFGNEIRKPKQSAVMLLLYLKNDEWHLLAIRRSTDGGVHSGQIGFPGGQQEPTDDNLLETALRETYEEVGIAPSTIIPLGALSPVYIAVSNFEVAPFVGFWHSPSPLSLSINEVEMAIELPIAKLFDPSTKTNVNLRTPANLYRNVNAYGPSKDIVIWGATALMIAELELLLNA